MCVQRELEREKVVQGLSRERAVEHDGESECRDLNQSIGSERYGNRAVEPVEKDVSRVLNLSLSSGISDGDYCTENNFDREENHELASNVQS